MHKNYNLLTDKERDFVDRTFSKDWMASGEMVLGYRLLKDDSVERAVEAVATWVIESRQA